MGCGDDRRKRGPSPRNRNAATLETLNIKHVELGSEVHTGGWRGYCGLQALSYETKTVNHTVEFVVENGTHTQQIELRWRQLRRKFGSGGHRMENIGEHLVEYMWRRDCLRRGDTLCS